MTDRAPDAARSGSELLRAALNRMSGAERRVRGRNQGRPGELTFAQLRSLAALGREGEMTAGELARSVDLNPATVTAMLDHLEAANLVERHRSTEDRRVCNVSLTPAGQELLDGKLARWQARWDEALANVSDDELETVVRVIEQVTGIYEEISAELDSPAQPSTGSSAISRETSAA
jgi:DNA-binding MarR family transcriptional regulator